MKYLPLIVTLIGTAATALITPGFISAHPGLFAIFAAAAQILHAALPSIFGATK